MAAFDLRFFALIRRKFTRDRAVCILKYSLATPESAGASVRNAGIVYALRKMYTHAPAHNYSYNTPDDGL